ncbi:zona pellucida-binding protein 1 [Rhinatrema bivittatum]|uniref:zona pellucida-binding protein 1 n=1 Tax=Rhinatrema bivittatum TaxID=194408 RepID=UPI00112DC8F9|nr:zona pellucida-binding protein 1 [Rhinatrema bivittatum]
MAAPQLGHHQLPSPACLLLLLLLLPSAHRISVQSFLRFEEKNDDSVESMSTLNMEPSPEYKNTESTPENIESIPENIESTSGKTKPTSEPKTTKKVVGSSIAPAKVYVKLNHNTPHVLCLTQRLRDAELTDPKYQWHGPEGQSLPDSSNVVVTPTGTLIIRHFKEEMSGMYTCSLQFATTVRQYQRKYFLKYFFYAYTDPNFFYELSVRYHSAPCQSIYNISFEKILLGILKKLVSQEFCEVLMLKAECHQVKKQRAGLHNEIFFLFSVFAVDTPEDVICAESCAAEDRLNKAKQLIERFFEKQAERLKEQINFTLPEIYFIQGTLHIVWVNRCFPGFGMDSKLHPDCLNCCVICSPGTYNPQDGVHCLPCNSSSIYGAKKC